jgi:hypothetical protein
MNSFKFADLPHEEGRDLYMTRFTQERYMIKYLQLRSNITFYALDLCIADYDKVGLNDLEIECIKDRAHTYLNYYKDFNDNNKDNFQFK